MLSAYSDTAPDRATLDATAGAMVIEFGSNACGYCKQAEPLIAEAMATVTVPHVRIQDGKGQRLGRSYRVKLWPTLIMLRDGKEIERVVRPQEVSEIVQALKLLDSK